MSFIDPAFKANRAAYALQCALAGGTVALIFGLLEAMTNIGVVAALAASTFIIFTMPHTKRSAPRYLVGGYVCAMVIGGGCYWLHTALDYPHVAFIAVAVALTALAMVVTNTEHPPAVGLAAGFMLLEQWRWTTPAAVLAGVITLSLVKRLFQRYMRNLL